LDDKANLRGDGKNHFKGNDGGCNDKVEPS